MRRIKFNDNYFENIDTEAKAYFLGFIAADGSIVRNRYSLCVHVNNKDIEVLNKFIKDIKFEGKVWNNPTRYDMCQLHLSGKKLIKDLEKYNIINNKTKILKYPQIDEKLERHFIRGYFDGDGCINCKKDKRDGSERGCVTIVGGSIEMINMLNERMCMLFDLNRNNLFGPKNKDYKFISWSGMTDVERIYNGFYKESNFYLERKKATFDKVIDIIQNKKKYRKK